MNKNPKLNLNYSAIPLKHLEFIRVFEEKSDCEIWHAFNRGDEMAFNFIYSSYVRDLFQYGCQFATDKELVKDSIQNVFIYLRKKRGTFSEVTNIKGYLFRSVQHEIIRVVQKEQRPAGFDETYLEKSFQIELSTETHLIRDETEDARQAMLLQGIAQLTVKQRRALLLFYEDELSYKEVSELMNLADVKSARKLIYRAISSLKKFIKPTSI